MLGRERREVAPRARSSEVGMSGADEAADRLAHGGWVVEMFVVGRRFAFGGGAPSGV